MPLDLRAIKERLAKATPGPWTAGAGGGRLSVLAGRTIVAEVPPTPHGDEWFIAAARQDVSALVSEVESLRAIVDAVREWQRGCSNAHPDRPEECPDCTRVFSEVVRERLASAIREEP